MQSLQHARTNSSTGTDVPDKSSVQHSKTLELVDSESYQEDDVVEEDDLEDLPDPQPTPSEKAQKIVDHVLQMKLKNGYASFLLEKELPRYGPLIHG